MKENQNLNQYLMQAYMDHSEEMVFVKDGDLRYVEASPAFLSAIGCKDKSQLIGKTDLELFELSDARRYMADDKAVLNSGVSIRDKEEQLVTDRGKITTSTSKYAIRDGKGVIIGILGIGRDITEKAQLIREAASASSYQRSFFAGISHDMRTPVSGILGLIHMMEEEELPDNVKVNLLKMESAGNYLLGLINDVLVMSRIQSNNFKLYFEPVSVKNLYDSIMEITGPVADQKKIHMSVYKEEMNQVLLLMDRVRVQQILCNVISNAVKYTNPGGEVEILVRCINKDAMHMTIETTVSDNGIGMEEEFIQRMFLPFEQEQNEFLRAGDGAGLGMAIVKKLVDMLEGSIRVKSKKGEGTTVTVTIPFEVAEIMDETKNELTDEGQLMGKKVLLCEDDCIAAKITEEMLKKAGCIVEHAPDGKKGVELYENSPEYYYDYILMDIRMPILDGLTASREIRCNNRCDAKRITIIAMTASSFDEDIAKSREAGMNYHLSKPFSARTLYRVMLKFIK